MNGTICVLGQNIHLKNHKPMLVAPFIGGTNLCKEIFFPGYPKTSASLNRLMPKYQFSRANWYVAEYDWVHQYEVLEWCAKQFGPHPRHPDAWSRWCNHYSERIHFRDEKDYHWFILKWGV